jgi:hypothetical protein
VAFGGGPSGRPPIRVLKSAPNLPLGSLVRVRIVTWNVEHARGKRAGQQWRLLDEVRADVAVLTEVSAESAGWYGNTMLVDDSYVEKMAAKTAMAESPAVRFDARARSATPSARSVWRYAPVYTRVKSNYVATTLAELLSISASVSRPMPRPAKCSCHERLPISSRDRGSNCSTVESTNSKV